MNTLYAYSDTFSGGAFLLEEVSGWIRLADGSAEVRMKGSDWVHSLRPEGAKTFTLKYYEWLRGSAAVTAMDSQFFKDHANDIAEAVGEAIRKGQQALS